MTVAMAHPRAAQPVPSAELDENLRRWLRFLGYRRGEWIEMQALGIQNGRGEVTKFAHVDNADDAARLCADIERSGCMGIFVVPNSIDPAVATRAERGRWHVPQRGNGTTDADIVARRVLLFDVDAVRPKGTSATDDEIARADSVARALYTELAELFESEAPLGFGDSGNGRQVFIALASIAETAELATLVRGIVNAVSIRRSTSSVHIDPTVVDAKRLMPAFGTMKRKGAPGIAERPHRRTSFTCQDQVHRLDLEDLTALHRILVDGLNDEQRAAHDKAMGIRQERSAADVSRSKDSSPFQRANELVPVRDALAMVNLLDGDAVRCPGCGTSGDSSVAIVGNGIKCMHARCARKGHPSNPGFRSVVDIVCEARGVEPREAVELLADRFGFQGFASRADTGERSARAPEVRDPFAATFRPLSAEALIIRPPQRRYLIARNGAGVLPLGKVGMLVAPGGVGKTLVVCQLALSVALGRRFLDTFDVVSPGPALLALAEEDEAEIHRRLHSAADNLGLSGAERADAASRIFALPLAGVNVQLTSGDGRGNVETTKIRDYLRAHLERAGLDWSLLILDPLSRWAGNDVEKDSHAATRFIEVVEDLSTVRGTPAVLLSHHTNKLARRAEGPSGAEAARGSSGLTDGVRFVANLDADGANVVVLRVTKNNYGPPTDPVHLIRQPEFNGALRAMSELEVEELEGQREQSRASRRAGRAPVPDAELDDRILRAVRRAGPQPSRRAALRLVPGEARRVRARIEAMLADGRLEPFGTTGVSASDASESTEDDSP